MSDRSEDVFPMPPIISAIADRSSGLYKSRAFFDAALIDGSMTRDSWRERLEAAAAEDNRSFREISLAAGLSHGYLHGILRDNKEPTLDRFSKICKELNKSTAFILLGANISAETEEIIKALEDHPDKRAAILSLLEH